MEWVRRVTWADLVAIIIILRSIYVGSQRGFFGELFHIFGVCLIIILSVRFYIPVSGFLNKNFFIPLNIAYIIGFLSISVIGYLGFRPIYNFFQKIIKIEILPAINKIGGPFIGFCKGFTLSVLFFFIMLLIPMQYVTDSIKTRSLFAPFFIKAGSVLYEKSLGILSSVKGKELEQLLAGVEPLKFSPFHIKKDKLDEVTQ